METTEAFAWHFISHKPADRRVSKIAMWQSKVAPSQLTGAISLLIPIKDVRSYLRIWLLGCLHHPSSGYLQLSKKREKGLLLSLLPVLGELILVETVDDSQDSSLPKAEGV